MRDVTSLKRSHERLMHDAVHDSLTGLPNRELFMDRLQGAITRAREGQGQPPDGDVHRHRPLQERQ